MNRAIILLLISLPIGSFAQKTDDWILNATTRENYQAPTMANGMIGIRVSEKPMESQHIILNGVFDKLGTDDVQCILPGINFANLELRTDKSRSTRAEHITDWTQQLNMKEAWLKTDFVLGKEIKVSHNMYALRHLPFSALFEVTLEAVVDVEVRISNKHSIDLPLVDGHGKFRTINRKHVQLPILTSSVQSPKGKHQISAASGFIFDEKTLPVRKDEWTENYYQQYFTIKLQKGEKYSFSLVGSTVSTANYQDPQTEAERQSIFAMLEGKDKLILNHKNAWGNLWETDIVLEGDSESQKDIRFALFNLYSSVRKEETYSIPPMGLTNLDYYGHIFWDAELWIYPALLALKPEMSKSMIDYRLKTIDAAKKNAKSHGYDGLMFPWEADDLGEESTPTWALTGPFEHHITAVVGIAIWNYYAVTQDLKWLEMEGFPVLKEITNFWLSRSTKDKNGKYHILNVVGADEYAENVDNNAFTNGAVITSTQYAIRAAKLLGEPIIPEWQAMATELVIEKFQDGTIKNYKGYKGEPTKQADVNLLTYPLQVVKDDKIARQNLSYYQKVVDPAGPAMTHSIYSIIYSQLNDRKKAWEFFQKGYKPNQRPPYGVLAEGAYDNNPYFMTAAGGLLQSVLFGFCGGEITPNGLEFNQPKLPTHWKSVTLKGFGIDRKVITIKNQ